MAMPMSMPIMPIIAAVAVVTPVIATSHTKGEPDGEARVTAIIRITPIRVTAVVGVIGGVVIGITVKGGVGRIGLVVIGRRRIWCHVDR
jgi:hypothetical protein